MFDLKEKLKNQALSIGSWITLAHPGIAEIMCRAGFEWLTVDLEHSVITLREAEEIIRVIDLHGVVPLVRLTSNDANQIKRVMDAGAKGIIVPMVNRQSDAEQAVSAVYYPPLGRRGVGLARAQGYGARFDDYKKWLERRGPIVIAQIEHIDGVKNIEAILRVEGIDGYIIGPYDLSASMGRPGDFQSDDFQSAMATIKEAAKKYHKPGGIHVVEPDPQLFQQYVEQAYTFLAYSLDTRMLDRSCRNLLDNVKKVAQ